MKLQSSFQNNNNNNKENKKEEEERKRVVYGIQWHKRNRRSFMTNNNSINIFCQ